MADLVLNEVLKQVSREHEGPESAEDSACEHDRHREKETIELRVKHLGVGISEHHDGVRDWDRENDTESQHVD